MYVDGHTKQLVYIFFIKRVDRVDIVTDSAQGRTETIIQAGNLTPPRLLTETVLKMFRLLPKLLHMHTHPQKLTTPIKAHRQMYVDGHKTICQHFFIKRVDRVDIVTFSTNPSKVGNTKGLDRKSVV